MLKPSTKYCTIWISTESLKYPSWTISGLNGICDKELHEHIEQKEEIGDDIENSHPGEEVALQKAGFKRCQDRH